MGRWLLSGRALRLRQERKSFPLLGRSRGEGRGRRDSEFSKSSNTRGFFPRDLRHANCLGDGHVLPRTNTLSKECMR